MALEVLIGRDWTTFTPGTTKIPETQIIVPFRDLLVAADALYNSVEFRAPAGRHAVSGVFGVTSGTATLSAGNIAVAFAFEGVDAFVAYGTANANYVLATPRVSAGALTANNLIGWWAGQPVTRLRFTSVSALAGTAASTINICGSILLS